MEIKELLETERCPECHCWYASSGYPNLWPCRKDCDCHYEAA